MLGLSRELRAFVALGQNCLSSWLSPYCSHHSPRFALFGNNELNDVNKLTKKPSNAVWPTDVRAFSSQSAFRNAISCLVEKSCAFLERSRFSHRVGKLDYLLMVGP